MRERQSTFLACRTIQGLAILFPIRPSVTGGPPLPLEPHNEPMRVLDSCSPLFPSCQATAIMYFKRFYLRQSFLNFDAVRFMLTCIYVAGKVKAVDNLLLPSIICSQPPSVCV